MENQSNYQGAERNFKVKQHYTKMSGEIKEIIVSMTKEHVGIKINIQRVRKIELLEIKIMTVEMKKRINRRVGN